MKLPILKRNTWAFVGMFFMISCSQNPKEIPSDTNLVSATLNTCDCYSSSPLYNVPITFNNQVPGDLQAFNNQSQADCFAWQSFIALTWPTNGTQDYGQPGNKDFVQWETYMPKDVLFNQEGTAPPPWGTLVAAEHINKFKSQFPKANLARTKLLTFRSKQTDQDTLNGLDFEQAAPGGKPNWLGAQNNTNVWYEIMLNKDYYDYVVQHGFYNAKTQHDSVQAGMPIEFPKGVYQGPVGAIEMKAAWMEVSDPGNAKWNRYKLSLATVLNPETQQYNNITVALVGLHILHKTTNQPTWVWATFEQIDNVPGSSTPPDGYNFYNANCQPQFVSLKDGSTDTVTCVPNTSPPYYLSQAAPVPIQINRTNPIDHTDAKPINTKIQASIKGFYPNSVWQYYELVDVIWSQMPQPDPTDPCQAPRQLNTASMQSGVHIVANTTLESYVQSTNTCYSCHVFSHIAPFPPDSLNKSVFADMSFAIKFANYNEGDLKEGTTYPKVYPPCKN